MTRQSTVGDGGDGRDGRRDERREEKRAARVSRSQKNETKKERNAYCCWWREILKDSPHFAKKEEDPEIFKNTGGVSVNTFM